MKRIAIFSLTAMMSFLTSAEENKPLNSAHTIGYKCYSSVIEKGIEVKQISHHEIDPLIEKALVSDLTDGYVFAKDGVTKLPVEKVYECIPRTQDFNDVVARQLDKEMPF